MADLLAVPVPAPVVPEAFTGPAPEPVAVPSRPKTEMSSTARPSASSRRPGAKKAVAKKTTAAVGAVDPRFENGPLAVMMLTPTGRCRRTASAAWSWMCPPSPSRRWSTGR